MTSTRKKTSILEALSTKSQEPVDIHTLPVGTPFRWAYPRLNGYKGVCLKLETTIGLKLRWSDAETSIAWTPLEDDGVTGMIYRVSLPDTSGYDLLVYPC